METVYDRHNAFYSDAEAVTAGSALLRGKTKLSTGEVIAKYPEGVTIIGFDLLTGKKGTPFAACVIAEDRGVYFNGGKTITEIVLKWLQSYEGDVTECNIALQDAGGVKVKLERTATKDGNSYTRVNVIRS